MGKAHGKDGLTGGAQGSTVTGDAAIHRPSLTDGADPRLSVFCAGEGPEVFRSVCHRHEIWREDPFDVPTIHEEARDAFARLLNQATTPPGLPAGRTLLILGESGAGKTHLMRVFRNHVHSRRLGYCGYLQMTSATDDYGRYVLSNLIDSLDQPYCEPSSDGSGLMCLSDALVEIPSSVLRKERESLREDRFDDRQLAKFIAHIADQIIEDERYAGCDVHLVQALLYLQRDEPRIKSRVLSYLRCEDSSEADRQVLGGMVPRTDPERTVETLGKLMWALQGVSLVVCVDQLEDMAHLDRDAERFRRAVGTVCALAERVPSSLWVISCLEDLYPPSNEASRGRSSIAWNATRNRSSSIASGLGTRSWASSGSGCGFCMNRPMWISTRTTRPFPSRKNSWSRLPTSARGTCSIGAGLTATA